MLSTWLDDTQTWAEPESLSHFQRAIPLEWVSQVLETTQKASIRKRRLPAELVAWLVIGMSLYRDRPITDVVSKLDLTLSTQKGDTLAASSIALARQRLTDAPLSELFHLTAHHWTQKQDDAHWLVPIKGNTKYRILETFSAGGHRVEMQVSAHARKQDTSLPETPEMDHASHAPHT